MTSDLETRLRAELRATARQIQPDMLRGLPQARPVPVRRPHSVRLAPAWAALAAITVLAAITAVAGLHLTGRRGDVLAPAAHGMPPYYVTAVNPGGLAADNEATVNSSVSGAVLSSIRIPGQSVTAVAAAASDQLFVLAATPEGGGATMFWKVTLGAGGTLARLSPLATVVPPGTQGYQAAGIAVSADGSLLAVDIVPGGGLVTPGALLSRIEVVSLRTGRLLRTWTAPAGMVMTTVSWARGDETLAFSYGPFRKPARQLRVLRVAGSGGLVTASSTVVPIQAPADPSRQAIAIADGTQFLAWSRASGDASSSETAWVLTAYSARTGRPVRAAAALEGLGNGMSPQLWSADPTGTHLLVGADGLFRLFGQRLVPPPAVLHPEPGNQPPLAAVTPVLGRIDNGSLAWLPESPGAPALPAAW